MEKKKVKLPLKLTALFVVIGIIAFIVGSVWSGHSGAEFYVYSDAQVISAMVLIFAGVALVLTWIIYFIRILINSLKK